MRVVAIKLYGKARGSVTCARLFFRSTGDRSAGFTLTSLCRDAPGDLSPVLNLCIAEGEPCLSSGQISICIPDERQEHPEAFVSEHM